VITTTKIQQSKALELGKTDGHIVEELEAWDIRNEPGRFG